MPAFQLSMELGDGPASGIARRRCRLNRAPAGLAFGRVSWFAMDSPLEGDGFEPSVPRLRRSFGAAVGRSDAAGDLAANARQQTSSFPRGHAFSGHTESKKPVEFRPWSYEFDGNRNARAM